MVRKSESSFSAKSSENQSSDVIEIPVGRLLDKARGNPWFVASIVLGLLLLGVLIFGTNGGYAVSESAVSEDVLDFLNSQVNGGVELNSIENRGGYYELMVDYQGDTIPIYATLDGKNIISDLIPLTGIPSQGTGSSPPTGEKIEVDIEGAYFKGDADAPVTIVEFSDFQCPFCERFYSQTLGLIEQNYVDTGKAKIVYMHFPLTSIHAEAQKAGEAAECAGEQGKFWEMHDKLFDNQASLSSSNYKAWARELKLDSAKFDSCLDSGKYAGKVREQTDYGSSLGVSGTPAFFINGAPISGAQPYSVFEQIIESELN